MTDSLHGLLEEHEGFVPHAYQDSLGIWTIGIGTMIDGRRGGGITHDEALYLLQNRIQKAALQLDRAIPWWRALDEIRRRILVDMCFNMGVGRAPRTNGLDDKGEGLLSFQNTLAHIKAGNYTLAAAGMLKSKWATQTGNRAQRLARMMESGRAVPKWW